MRVVIGVIGPGSCDEEIAARARAVGRAVAQCGAVLLTGGRGGVMAAAAEGAYAAGGLTLGILPGASKRETPPNPFIDIALCTGLGEARNAVNVCASDALIAVGGGWGTLSEIALAAKAGKPVVLLGAWAELGDRPGLVRAGTPDEAVQLVLDALARQGR